MWKCQQFEFKQKLVHNWNRDQWISWLTLCRFPWPNIFIMIIKTTFKAEGKQNVKNWLPFVIWCWKQNWWFLVPFFIYIFTFAKRSKQNLSNSFLFCFSFSSLHHSKQRKKKEILSQQINKNKKREYEFVCGSNGKRYRKALFLSGHYQQIFLSRIFMFDTTRNLIVCYFRQLIKITSCPWTTRI